jgi:lysophospholipase L1-like esterase
MQVVLCSVLPVHDYPWKRGIEPASTIIALNAWIREYARTTGAAYADFHSAMADERQGLRAELTRDGVHPNEAGYRLMAPIVERAIEAALQGGR